MNQQSPVKSEQTFEKYFYLLFQFALSWFAARALIQGTNYGERISALGFLVLGIIFIVNRKMMDPSWRVRDQTSRGIAIFWLLSIATALLLVVVGVIVEYVVKL